MFMLRGLPFVDLAYLRKSDLRGNVITYRRRKTGRSLAVTETYLKPFRSKKIDEANGQVIDFVKQFAGGVWC